MRTAVVLASLPLALAIPAKGAQPAPLLKPRGVQLIDGKYIVKLKHTAIDGALSSAMSTLSSDADYVYNTGKFKGFASGLTAGELDALRNDDNVSYLHYSTMGRAF
jgi:hypothetical protein